MRRRRAVPMRRTVAAIVATLAGCVLQSTPPSGPAEYRYVVLGPDGVAVARVITVNAQCPPIDIDGATRAMTVRMAPATIPVRPSRADLPAPKASAFPVLTCEMTLPRRHDAGGDRRAGAAAAQGRSQTHRRDRRHGLPRHFELPGSSRAATTLRHGRSRASPTSPPRWRPISSFTSATITIAKAHAPRAMPGAPAARGATGGTRGRPIFSSRRAICSPPRRGSSCAAITNRAIARGRAGGASWIRGRSHRGRTATRRPTTISATTAMPTSFRSAAARTRSSSYSIRRNVGVTPFNPSDLMYRNYKSEMEYAFARTAHARRACSS